MSDIRSQARRDAEFDQLLDELNDADFGYIDDDMRQAYEMGKRHGIEHALEVSEKWADEVKP